MKNTNNNNSLINKTFALNRHVYGWGLVTVVSIDSSGLAIVSDSRRKCSYPASISSLKNPITLSNAKRAMAEAA